MIDKISASVAEALADVSDGATVMIGGFGTAGIPNALIDGLIAQGARELTIVNNNAGNGDSGLAALLMTGRVRKIICSFPRQADSHVFDALYRSGKIELELVPQGNLAERIRAAGAGVGAFFTPTGYGTDLARHSDGSPKETREINGRMYVLEYPIHGDVALIKAERGDRWGNLTFAADDPETEWDGYNRAGEPVPGVYIWKIEWVGELFGVPHTYRAAGDVTIVR